MASTTHPRIIPPAGDDGHLEGLSAYAARLPKAGSNSQLAYRAVLGGILNDVLRPGQRLAEIPVARAIGVGRTPVREALMRLETDGFVTRVSRSGMVVADNTLASLVEIYEVLEVLEEFGGRLASRFARADDIFALQQILEESITPTKNHDVMRLRTLNVQFHGAVHAAARNDQLRSIGRNLQNLVCLSSISNFTAPGRSDEVLEEHRAIFKAIVDRDEERAAKLAREHRRRDKETRLELMTKAMLSG